MNPVQLKENFHKLIDNFQDMGILEDFFDIISQFQQGSNSNEILDDLTETQQERLNASLRQARTGKTQTDGQVRAKVKSWLAK